MSALEIFSSQGLRLLNSMQIGSKRALLGKKSGSHVSPRRGHGMEFAEYRHYIAGDNPRNIDWNVYAKTEKYYVKTYQEEHNLAVAVILDDSQSMLVDNKNKKWQVASTLAVALGYIGLVNGESFYFIRQNQHNEKLAVSNLTSLRELAQGLIVPNKVPNELSGAPEINALRRFLATVRLPGVAAFISDLMLPLVHIEQILITFARANMELVVFNTLGELDLNPLGGELIAHVEDSETKVSNTVQIEPKKYEEALSKHCQQVIKMCHQRGFRYIKVANQSADITNIATILKKSGFVY